MPQGTDKLYHTMLYGVHFALSRIQTHISGDTCRPVTVCDMYRLSMDM